MEPTLKTFRSFRLATRGAAIFLVSFTHAIATPITGDTVTGNLTVNGAEGEGNVAALGWGLFQHGIDIGTNGEALLNWSGNSTAGTAMYDIKPTTGSYLWRDSLSTTVTNKMLLDDTNTLTLYKQNGTTVGITLDPINERINFANTGSGIYRAGSPLLTIGSNGKLVANSLTLTDYTALSKGLLNGYSNNGALSVSMSNGVTDANSATAMSESLASGEGSTAMSYSHASGEASTAMSYGYASAWSSVAMSSGQATEDSSTAMSYGTASGVYSTAMSNGAASGESSTAMSLGEASGDYSTAMSGGYTFASYAVGMSGGYAQGDNTTAMSGGTANGFYATGMADGYANGDFSTAMSGGTADGYYATAMTGGHASGENATAMSGGAADGLSNTGMTYGNAIGDRATAMSHGTASGSDSTAMSYGTASGSNSTAMSNGTAAGIYSTAAGYNAKANSYSSVSFGRYNTNGGNAAAWVETDPLLLVGNGTGSSALTNALATLKNGQTTLTNKAWKANPSVALDATNSNGEALVVEGNSRLRGKVTLEQPQGDIPMFAGY